MEAQRPDSRTASEARGGEGENDAHDVDDAGGGVGDMEVNGFEVNGWENADDAQVASGWARVRDYCFEEEGVDDGRTVDTGDESAFPGGVLA